MYFFLLHAINGSLHKLLSVHFVSCFCLKIAFRSGFKNGNSPKSRGLSSKRNSKLSAVSGTGIQTKYRQHFVTECLAWSLVLCVLILYGKKCFVDLIEIRRNINKKLSKRLSKNAF